MAVEAEARCVGELSAAQRHSWLDSCSPTVAGLRGREFEQNPTHLFRNMVGRRSAMSCFGVQRATRASKRTRPDGQMFECRKVPGRETARDEC